MLNISLIGYGYWGPKLARNISAVEGLNLHSIADRSFAALTQVQKQYPEIQTYSDAQQAIDNPTIDVVVIATPVGLHYPLAKASLLAGKHVLVEKPLCSSSAEADELFALADKAGKKLMVDHTYLYTGSVQAIKKMVDTGELGNINYVDSTRINLGLFQHDVNVLWDLAPHDISITSYLLDQAPVSVSACGAAHAGRGIENITYLTLKYEQELIAHFNCSWVSPVKIRHFLIGGDKKMVLFNDLEATEKIRVYDSGYNVKDKGMQDELQVDYRIGDVHIPKIPTTEALYSMLVDFRDFIQLDKEPISNERVSRNVVAVLEMAQRSIKNTGILVA